MTTDPTPGRTSVIYDSIDAFQRTHRLPGLQHAQIRGLLAEHLARALPAAVSVSAAAPPTGQGALREDLERVLHELHLQRDFDATEDVDAVLAVLPPPADRAAVLREAGWTECSPEWLAAHPSECGTTPRVPGGSDVSHWHPDAALLRRLAAEAPEPATQAEAQPDDVDPVYDPRAWETYRRDAGCGCTAAAPVDCKVPHGTGAWLCVCHRLAGPPARDTDPPGKPLALLGVSKHFQEPNRCLSTEGIFRCSRPTGHLGDHRTGRTFWSRRAAPAAVPAVGQTDEEA